MTVSATESPAPRRYWLALTAWLLICFLAAAGGVIFMPGPWFASLHKPAWNPPAWLFGPVWTVLYVMMAIAAWLVWQRGGWARQKRPLGLFLTQLALNAAWTPLFFGLKNPPLAFGDIIVLWLTLAATLLSFRRVNKTASWLLAPYLAWVSFAALLNCTLWRLNQ